MDLNDTCKACHLKCTNKEAVIDAERGTVADYVDPCLGYLPGVRYACCGHGEEHGYIFFDNGVVVRGDFTLIEKQMYNAHNDFSEHRKG